MRNVLGGKDFLQSGVKCLADPGFFFAFFYINGGFHRPGIGSTRMERTCIGVAYDFCGSVAVGAGFPLGNQIGIQL